MEIYTILPKEIQISIFRLLKSDHLLGLMKLKQDILYYNECVLKLNSLLPSSYLYYNEQIDTFWGWS
jgi:hypothetical protein